MNTLTITRTEAERLMNWGKERHMEFRIVTHDLPGWRYESLEKKKIFDSNIPDDALRIVYLILKSGTRIEKLRLAHETPILPFTLPWRVAPEIAKPSVWREKARTIFNLENTWNVFKTLGLVTGGLLLVALALPLILTVALPLLMLTALLAVDPALILVLEDGSMVEVFRWWN